MSEHDGIIIATNIYHTHLDEFRFRHRRSLLTLGEQLLIVAHLQDLEVCAHHFHATELPLLLQLLRQFRSLVKDQLASHVLTFHLQILHHTHHLAALVHVEQHRVALILRQIYTWCKNSSAVAVHALITDSYSFTFSHIYIFKKSFYFLFPANTSGAFRPNSTAILLTFRITSKKV